MSRIFKKIINNYGVPASELSELNAKLTEVMNTINRYSGTDTKVLDETPLRVIKSWLEASTGYNEIDPVDIIGEPFEVHEGEKSNVVYVDDINFSALCAHHMLPFYGTVSISYELNDEKVGLSKFGRIVDYISKKPTDQETLTREIKEYIVNNINTNFVEVRIKAEHTCMTTRGTGKIGASTSTISSYFGGFDETNINQIDVS